MKISQLRILWRLQNSILRYNKMVFRGQVSHHRAEFQKGAFRAGEKSARNKHASLLLCHCLESGCLRDERRDLFILSHSTVSFGGSRRNPRHGPASFLSHLCDCRPAGKSETAEPTKKLFGGPAYALSGRFLFLHALLAIDLRISVPHCHPLVREVTHRPLFQCAS